MAYSKTNWTNNVTPINETNLNKIENQLQKSDIFNVAPSSISTNDDLNNYTTYGIYVCSSQTTSASLSNNPITTTGFKLIVEYLHDVSRIRQTIYANNATSDTFVRTYSASGWGVWIKQPNYSIYERPLTSISSNSNLNSFTTPRNFLLSKWYSGINIK